MTAPKILCLDIETAPNKAYTWGLFNQNIGINQIVEAGYTLCWAANWLGSKQGDAQFKSVYHDSTEDMVQTIWNLLDEADAVIHYNGKRFDIPKLNLEFLKQGLTPPSPYWQIDLLAVVRHEFRFASNKLDYVAQALGIGKKIHNKGMPLWTECMMKPESEAESKIKERAWSQMRRYNLQDIHLLPKLYKILLPWITQHPNHGVFADSQTPTCPNCGSKHVHQKGFRTTKVGKFPRYKCGSCGKWSQGRRSVTTLARAPGVLKG